MKNLRLKKVNLFFSSLFLVVMHLPFGVAKSKANNSFSGAQLKKIHITHQSIQPPVDSVQSTSSKQLYDSLKLFSYGLSQQVFDYALKGFNYIQELGKLSNKRLLTIVDFSKPSNLKRLFVIDLQQCKVVFNTYVAHGQNSGTLFANRFSNVPESFQSSLGFYETSGTYIGKNGYSMHLIGLERGINDNAERREIVMHGADYVDERLIRTQGYIGRSWGCPAVSHKLSKPIIDRIKNGTCLFIYNPERKYLLQSKIINHSNSMTALN
ncbi:MAG: murein L,D-transpeptidase catalytic domain family protein [Ferruginibacter sp.]